MIHDEKIPAFTKNVEQHFSLHLSVDVWQEMQEKQCGLLHEGNLFGDKQLRHISL